MRSSYRLAAFCSLACSLILAAPLAIVTAVERAVAFLFALLPASADRSALALDVSDRQVAFAGDFPVSPAVSNALRHEAGMRRLT